MDGDTNLIEAIKSLDPKDLTPKHKRKVLKDSPWSYIPNVKSFQINLNILNPILKLININKKLNPQLIFEPYDNKRINRFIEHSVINLNKHKSNPEKYFKFANILLKRSNSFRVLAFNHVLQNWHRNYPLEFVLICNYQVSRIINKNKLEPKIIRKYIEKKDSDKKRPLGIPSIPWRIVLHMHQNFLTYYIMKELSPNQHGFLPTRGTLSAWKAMITKNLVNKKWIYEYDFVNYFGSIYPKYIRDQLQKFKIPEDWQMKLMRWNATGVILPKKEELDESNERMKHYYQEFWKIFEGTINDLSQTRELLNRLLNQKFHPNYERLKRTIVTLHIIPHYQLLMGCLIDIRYLEKGQILMEDYDPRPEWRETFEDYEITKEHYTEYVEKLILTREERNLLQELIKLMLYEVEIEENTTWTTDSIATGFAQGSAISPILGNIAMEEWLKDEKGITTIAYADDSISFSDEEFKKRPPAYSGIEINESKSGWIKKDGKWQKELKFLGLIYNGDENVWKAQTRKGSNLAVTQEIKDVSEIIEHVRQKKPETMTMSHEEVIRYLSEIETDENYESRGKGSWIEFFKSKIIGFIQNRIYSGDWNLKNIVQDFEFHYVKKSWVESKHRIENWDLNIFNSTSYASLSLLEIFRQHQLNYKKGNLNYGTKGRPTLKARFVISSRREREDKGKKRNAYTPEEEERKTRNDKGRKRGTYNPRISQLELEMKMRKVRDNFKHKGLIELTK